MAAFQRVLAIKSNFINSSNVFSIENSVKYEDYVGFLSVLNELSRSSLCSLGINTHWKTQAVISAGNHPSHSINGEIYF